MKISFTGKDGILHLGGVLLALCLIIALALGYVNSITADRIAESAEQQLQQSMKDIIPTADRFNEIAIPGGEASIITRAFEIIKDGVYVGLCVQVAPNGFSGPINMVVAVYKSGAVLGVHIVSMTETIGLGTQVDDPEWLVQFEGLSAPFTVVKNAAPGEGDIAAVSGATVSSRAVTQGVTAAAEFVLSYTPEVK